MRARLTALRAAGTAAMIVAAPVSVATAAYAGDGVRVTVSPSSAAPGGEVEIKVDGCRDDRAKVTSEAFAREVKVGGEKHSGLFGDAVIASSASPGRYDVDVRCDGREHAGAGTVRVVAGGGGHHDDDGHATPHAPVPAGGGGTAPQAAEAGGPGTPYTVTGLALAGVAAVSVAVRSSRRRRAAAAGNPD